MVTMINLIFYVLTTVNKGEGYVPREFIYGILEKTA